MSAIDIFIAVAGNGRATMGRVPCKTANGRGVTCSRPRPYHPLARFFAVPLMAAAPPPTAVTSALVDAARKEGKVSFYTAGAQHRRTLEQDVRSQISRHRRACRAFRCGADFPARRTGSGQRHQCGRRRQQRTDPAHYLVQNKREEASRAVEQIMVLDPTFRWSSLRQLIPLRRAEDLATYAQGFVLLAFPNEPDATSLSLLVWAIPVSRHKWI